MSTKSRIHVTQVSEWNDGHVRRFQDYLVTEEPLEMRVNGKALSVTMRTPGHDLELTAGFLFTEGLIADSRQIHALRQMKGNVVEAEVESLLTHPRRSFVTTSSCGICGKDSIDSVRVRGIRRLNDNLAVDPQLLCRLPEKLRSAQAVFARTGSLHAAGLFSAQGELLKLREDIGRHNAVDKVLGWALLARRIPLSDHILVVSGRGGFEIVQKALVAGVPAVASVSAPSSLAVQLAREFNQTLVGFLRGQRFVIYSGEQRLLASNLGADKRSQTRMRISA